MKKLFEYLSYGTIILAFVMIVSIIYLRLWPPTLVFYHINPIPVVGEKVFRPGEAVPLHFKFTRYTNALCMGHRKLINETVTPLASIMGRARTKGDFDFVTMSNILPQHIQPSDSYYFEFTFEYRVNFLRTEYVKVVTEPFKVIAKERH